MPRTKVIRYWILIQILVLGYFIYGLKWIKIENIGMKALWILIMVCYNGNVRHVKFKTLVYKLDESCLKQGNESELSTQFYFV